MEIVKGGVVFLNILFAVLLVSLGIGSAKNRDIPATAGLLVMAMTNFMSAAFIIFL